MAMPEWIKRELRENYAKASRAARFAARIEPRAAKVTYRTRERALHIGLTNGIELTIPVRLISELKHVVPREIAEVEILGRGDGLHWESLDLDISVPGLVTSLFDSRTWMAELGRVGGRRSSPEKTAAARKNGRKGGRPRTAPTAVDELRR